MSEDRYRMGFHLMPPQGWLNDPNGLCHFNGEYHVFFQYTPENPLGGQKYWGHYISGDLVNWRFAGIALRPDRDFDRNGAYSGSALVTGEPGGPQKMRIYYTGNVKLDGDHDYIDLGREANVVYTESVDGIHFSEKQLLMTNADYPADYTCHVRDPKVFWENGRYRMVLGGRKRGGQAVAGDLSMAGSQAVAGVPSMAGSQAVAGGQDMAGLPAARRQDFGAVLLYRSVDGMRWELEREITTPEPFGYMWECPDLFSLGGRSCLSFCPQGLEAEPCRFQNTDQSGYVWLDGETVDTERFVEWDMGFEFYAPQTFEDESGRRILMGWVGLPELPYDNPTVERGWQHCLTIPRELSVRDGVICQNPAEELDELKENEQVWWGDGGAETADCSFWLRTEQMDTDSWSFTLGGELFLHFENKVFTWEFPDGKTEAEDWGRGRRVRRMELERLTDIQILCDHSVLEIFVNGGRHVMCGRFYPSWNEGGKQSSRRVCLRGCGAHAETHFWHMRAMEVVEDEEVTGDR